MKRHISLLALIVILVIGAFLLSACGNLGGWLPDSESPETPEAGNGDGNPETPEENEFPETPAEPKTVKLTLKNKNRNHKVETIIVESGGCLTDEQVAYLYTVIDYTGGYRFSEWLYDDGSLFDPLQPIESDLTIYGVRDDLAGIDVQYSISEDWTELVIYGAGPMYDFYFNDDAPWSRYANLITSIRFEGEITTIGSTSFYGFDQISEVVLPDTITRIGKNAFYESTVSDINFPELLTEIGDGAFYKCKNLTTLDFNKNLVTIGSAAFEECIGVKRVILTDNLALIDGGAFNYCDGIEAVYYVGSSEQYDTIKARLNNFWVRELTNTYFLSEEEPEKGPYCHYDGEGRLYSGIILFPIMQPRRWFRLPTITLILKPVLMRQI